MKYTIYNETTGEILRTVDCPENMIDVQLQSDEEYVEGISNDITQKVDDGVIVDKTQIELDDYAFSLIENTIPKIDTTIVDAELNISLNEYFISRIDVKQWRIDNYSILRKKHYPLQEVFIDAYIKLNSNISEFENQGQIQMDDYIQKCLNIKSKFPKE